ncbi:DUF485 domain-containing protein [Arthrobacter sp. zg-Y916]|uniref:DUF485 domain-containing protein n=1 Tax=Arthrobacter caoxuetaonis TaxID=2886935 RepID=A0A9X1SDS7_9MICC|nr:MULTISPECIES: DUF485 domain-containing protein [Arthrobacter]MCC3297104.1 DUF485 domain-containing protein [Arthrobacter caoxuetaonis]MCC9193992.1 DUF485 domain-containing protein [Arthrobacter sp. zg-Y916]USQ58334.1 DUF485 domain-containing protein [Arthrobacter caoxuetaonis]
MNSANLPQRVRVTAPRAPGAAPAVFPVARELDEQSEVGEVFLSSLIRSQLRLALVVAGGFGLIMVGVPLLLAAVPQLSAVEIFDIPVPWLLLGLGVYPLVIVSGALYVRSANRNEKRFQDLLDEG